MDKNSSNTEVGFDIYIDELVGDFMSKYDRKPTHVIMNPVGVVILKELLMLDYDEELPNTYKNLKVAYYLNSDDGFISVV